MSLRSSAPLRLVLPLPALSLARTSYTLALSHLLTLSHFLTLTRSHSHTLHLPRSFCLTGITVGTVSVPLSLAIALGSGVPPALGIISTILGSTVGALMGGTTLAISAPSAAMSVVSGKGEREERKEPRRGEEYGERVRVRERNDETRGKKKVKERKN